MVVRCCWRPPDSSDERLALLAEMAFSARRHSRLRDALSQVEKPPSFPIARDGLEL